MTPIEIIALVFAIIILVKAVMVFFNANPMMKFVEKIYDKTVLLTAVYLVFLVIVGYFLLMELNIAQVFAAALFGIMLYALVLIQYPKELLSFSKKALKNRRKAWLPWLIFIFLALWVLYMLFF